MDQTKVALIGLGAMGSSLACAFVKAGVAVTAWNRTRDRATVKEAIDNGAVFEYDIEAIIRNNDVLVICVIHYDAIYSIFTAAKSTAFTGKTIINLSSGTPKQALEMESWTKEHGAAHYFDGAVMVTPEMISTEHSFLILSGGSEQTFSRKRGIADLLAPLGRLLYQGEDVDIAAASEIATGSAMYGMVLGTFIGLNLLRKAGRKTLPSTEQVVVPVLQAIAPLLNVEAKKIDEQNWLGGGANPLAMQISGIENILRACDDADVDGSGLESMARILRQAAGNHGADAGLSASVLYLEKQ